jgi:hypothetical protein
MLMPNVEEKLTSTRKDAAKLIRKIYLMWLKENVDATRRERFDKFDEICDEIKGK